MNFWPFEKALEKRLEAWKIYPEVKVWAKQNFGKIIRTRFFYYIRLDEYYETVSIYRLAELCDIDRKEISSIVISSLPEHISNLSANSLIQLLEISFESLDQNEKVEFLNWVVEKWNEKIKPDFGDGDYSKVTLPPKDVNIFICRLLRYNLGHPDKRKRWSAAKSLIQLVNYGNIEILKALINEQNDIRCDSFQDSKNVFYWIAAKLWLWISIHRISVSNPEILLTFAKDFYQEILNPKITHAQILYFVKSTCLHLESKSPGTYDVNELLVINQCLVSNIKPLRKKEPKVHRSRSEIALRFQFDPLDTIDHWFEPLGRVFNMNGYEVAEVVDKILCDEWGVTGNTREDNHVISNDYELTRHYKSDIPIIEDLRTYYEYHGMQCAAGLLIKTKPLIGKPTYYESWEDWMEDYNLIWKNVWLSELKDPIPLQAIFWNSSKTNNDWQWNIQLKDLSNLIGFGNKILKDFLVVNGHATINYGKDYERHGISSALLKPKYALSAMRAMQTINRHDFGIPLEKDTDYNEEVSPKFLNFKLIPWIQHLGIEHRGVDESDGQIYDFEKNRYVLGESFSAWAKLNYSNDKRFSFSGNDTTKPVSIFESWSNTPRNPSYSSFYSKGSRLFVSANKLLSFLKHADLVLLINAEIYRRPETKDYNVEFAYYNMFYLIYPDGTVKTISGDFKLR